MRSKPETHRIEYKRELTPDLDLEKEVIAFLNAHEGGFIFIGVDKLGTPIGVADLDGDMLKIKDRVHLIESNEYGYCSLIKATKRVLDKLDLENRTSSTITAKGRTDVRLWSPIALREAVINAIVHNDYTREVPPKFEIFSDRIEITSAGTLPEGLTQAEFFEGYSIPRNKELMRIFKDLEMVEHLGSGIPRITQFFPEDCFRFTENFIRSSFPSIEPVHAEDEVTPQVIGVESGVESGGESPMVRAILSFLTDSALSKLEIARKIGKDKPTRYHQ